MKFFCESMEAQPFDEIALPPGVDPSRWPFCEARARAAAALSAFPVPPIATAKLKVLRRPPHDARALAAQRRARLREVKP